MLNFINKQTCHTREHNTFKWNTWMFLFYTNLDNWSIQIFIFQKCRFI